MLGTVFVAVLAMGTPGSGSMLSAGVTHTLTPPFHGATSHYSARQLSGCGRNIDLPGPSFNLTTGIGGFNISSRAVACAKGGGNSSASIFAWVSSRVAVPYRAGVTQVVANVPYGVDLKLGLRGGTCSSVGTKVNHSCQILSAYNVSIQPELIDLTSNYYYAASGSPVADWWHLFNDSYCYSGSCGVLSGGAGCHITSSGCGSGGGNRLRWHIAGNATWLFSLGAPMVSGHRYVLWIVLEGVTLDLTYRINATLVGAEATSSIDFLTGRDGFALHLVTER